MCEGARAGGDGAVQFRKPFDPSFRASAPLQRFHVRGRLVNLVDSESEFNCFREYEFLLILCFLMTRDKTPGDRTHVQHI